MNLSLKSVVLTFFLLISGNVSAAQATQKPLPLRIVTEEMPPFNYSGDNGEVVGIATDIVKRLKIELNINSPIEMMPWTRAYRHALNQPNVLIYSIARTKEREDLFHWLVPYTVVDMQLFALPGNTLSELTNPETAKDKTIGMLRDSSLVGYMRGHKDFHHVKITEVVSYEMIYRMNQRKRLDYFMAPKLFVEYLNHKFSTGKDTRPVSLFRVPDEKQVAIYLALSKATEQGTVDRVKDKLDELKRNGEIAKMFSAFSKRMKL